MDPRGESFDTWRERLHAAQDHDDGPRLMLSGGPEGPEEALHLHAEPDASWGQLIELRQRMGPLPHRVWNLVLIPPIEVQGSGVRAPESTESEAERVEVDLRLVAILGLGPTPQPSLTGRRNSSDVLEWSFGGPWLAPERLEESWPKDARWGTQLRVLLPEETPLGDPGLPWEILSRKHVHVLPGLSN